MSAVKKPAGKPAWVCQFCDGRGQVDGADCEECRGKGYIEIVPCEKCGGSGHLVRTAEGTAPLKTPRRGAGP